MRLYTEEKVREALEIWFDSSRIWTQDDVLRELTPIELPSDEEIENEIQETNEGINAHWKIEGAKWLREKITKTE